jgi:pimeloyl-ACP methyl ester carboxylesterase
MPESQRVFCPARVAKTARQYNGSRQIVLFLSRYQQAIGLLNRTASDAVVSKSPDSRMGGTIARSSSSRHAASEEQPCSLAVYASTNEDALMTILHFIQRVFGIASIALLGCAIFLIWRWAEQPRIYLERPSGETIQIIGATPIWPLAIGLLIVAISLFGRFIFRAFLGSADGSTNERLTRSNGELVTADDGATLYVEQHGTRGGPIIVFTHGWGMDSTIWHEAKAQLADRFHLIAWDLPGLGKSKMPTNGRISVESMATNLKSVLSVVEGQRVILAGHSIGGMITQTFCSAHRELLGNQIAGIVLENTTHTNPIETTFMAPFFKAIRWPIIEPMLWFDIIAFPLTWAMNWSSYLNGSAHLTVWITSFGSKPTRAQLDQIAYLQTRNSPAVQAKGTLAMMRWSVTEALSSINVPALVFVGERDLITLPSAGERIADLIAGAELQRFDRAGHMGPVELAKGYNRELARFATRANDGAMQEVTPSPQAASRSRVKAVSA